MPDGQTAYLVIRQDWEWEQVIGVYTDRRDAKRCAKVARRDMPKYVYAIEAHSVDLPYEDHSSDRQVIYRGRE